MANAGSYRIWTADKDGNLVDGPDPKDPSKNPYPVPGNPHAVDIYFGLDPAAPQPPPKEQSEIQAELGKILGVLRRLYLSSEATPNSKFRRYYVRVFRLAQLGLEGANPAPDVARSALQVVTRDLIDDEATRVKNGHLLALGRSAMSLGAPFFLIYLLLAFLDHAHLDPWLEKVQIDRQTAANFMLLWIGCFLGVWLSYGIRTSRIALEDLVNTDADRLLPHVRLVFAGALTMILGMMFSMGVIEIKIGSYVVTSIANNSTLAFIVGVLCGISEASLPTVASKRATAFVDSIN